MTSAAESFVISLARASKRGHRYLRGLKPADRDDVLSTALLHCWENKAMYDPSVALEEWFMSALKDARRSFKRGEHVTTKEFNFEMAVPDDTSARAEALAAAEVITAAFTDREHSLLLDLMGGSSWREIMRTHHASGQEVGNVTRKLARLRALIPERRDWQKVVRRFTAGSVPISDAAPQIDREIAQLDMPPPPGKECPVCWRCMWYYAVLPTMPYVQRRTVEDEEVQLAIWNTESEKIKIATAIQNGTWRTR